jgi:hypothetical protein
VTPDRKTVRLVDREEAHLHAPDPLAEGQAVEALGGDVEELDLALLRHAEALLRLTRRQRRVDELGRNPLCFQALDLVLHERDQRRHHQGHAGQQHRAGLVDHALPGSGREHRQSVPAIQDGFDDLTLLGTEVLVSPVALQDMARVLHRRLLRQQQAAVRPGGHTVYQGGVRRLRRRQTRASNFALLRRGGSSHGGPTWGPETARARGSPRRAHPGTVDLRWYPARRLRFLFGFPDPSHQRLIAPAHIELWQGKMDAKPIIDQTQSLDWQVAKRPRCATGIG